MDIIKTRESLNNIISELIHNYTNLTEKYNELQIKDTKNSVSHNDNISSLMNEIKQKDKEISEIKKCKHDYELMINDLNVKIENLLIEEDNKNKHDIIKIQAKELDEKDRVIEILQNKIIKLKGEPKPSILKDITKIEKQINNIVNDENKPVESDDNIKNDMIVFTDGACSDNGSENAKAGIGVYFGEGDERNVSRRISGKQTNNTAELKAILEVFEICNNEIEKGDKITIYSDSTVAIGWCTTTGEKYEKNNWTKKKGEIPNLELVKQGYELCKKYPNVSMKHVKAHTGKRDNISIGNEMADKLATQSLLKPDIIDTDLQNSSDEDEEVWMKVRTKGVQYIIIKGEQPQYTYKITEEGLKGEKVGVRVSTNGRHKYEFY